MQALFTSLMHAVEGAPVVAMAAAVAWGILSIVLSPCHLAGIPLIVGYIDQQGRMGVRRNRHRTRRPLRCRLPAVGVRRQGDGHRVRH